MKIEVINNRVSNHKKVNIKIIHFADIHFNLGFDLNIFKGILEVVLNNKPLYVCLTGDLIDNTDITHEKFINYFYEFIRQLSQLTKVIISLGNHEFYTKSNFDISNYLNVLKTIPNVVVLNNSSYVNNNIRFIGYTEGMANFNGKKHNKEVINEMSILLDGVDDNKYNILLAHSPLEFINNKYFKDIHNINKVNLILCGHTHGGLLSSSHKGHFGLVSPNRTFFPKNVRGMINKDGRVIIVNTAIIKLSRVTRLIGLNFLFKPSINVIEINDDKL